MRNPLINMREKVLLTLLILPLLSIAQRPEIKNLVFEGAGMRGLAYAGVVAELESSGLIDEVEKVGGTSAGALTAVMISLGYTSVEIRQKLSETEFQKFNDGSFGGISRMKRNFGWFRGSKFTEWVANQLDEKTGNPDITLIELYEAGYIPVYLVTTCINQQELKVLSHETYPNMKVKDAVRASISIPLYFKAVFVDSEGNTYDDYDDGENLDILVDGGIIGNYPIFLFDSQMVINDLEFQRTPNRHTLGFRIDSEAQIKQDSVTRKITSQEIDSFKNYVAALYNFTMESLNRNQMTNDDWLRTVSISSVGIGPMIKKFSKTDQNKLIESGQVSMRKYLDEWRVVETRR